MTKLFRNVLIAVALLALTITGVWAALSDHSARFGGKVSFIDITPGLDFVGVVTHDAKEFDRYEYKSEDTESDTIQNWNIEDIRLTKGAPVVTFSFTFKNVSNGGEYTVTIDTSTSDTKSNYKFEGGLVVAEVVTEAQTAVLAEGESATFVYELEIENFVVSEFNYAFEVTADLT